MAKKNNKIEKTNVMRILDAAKINYTEHSYVDTDAISGIEVAEVMNQDPMQVFKTLVVRANTGEILVFMVPSASELNLKKAAVLAGVKNVEMIKSRELLPLTGYIHGGCSPIGMKKVYRTFIDESHKSFKTVICSAGKIGYQVEISFDNLVKIIPVVSGSII
ncbi:MAG: Cys-tRNA(Pro) deacylase [Eubacteriales bacterium]|nr:Cys-tRNA(Pro) deacylase [Eubacteriales bacterium]MDY3332429.1 Cys-tRNA(Pro) deacylase [Gallibacter sp.]